MLNINFPLYPLRKYNKLIREDGIVYIETYFGTYVLDNKNLSGETLAERRSKSTSKLYPLKEKVSTFKELVLSKRKIFVDRYGNILKYKKTTFVSVTCHEVLSIKNTLAGAYIVQLKGIPKDLVYYEELPSNVEYALIFNTKYGRYLFGFSDTYFQKFKIKI